MTVVVILVAFSVVALLWCLLGFCRAMKEPRKVIGLVIRAETPLSFRKRPAEVLEFPDADSKLTRDGKRLYRRGSSGAKGSD